MVVKEQAFFILGAPRSATTFLATVLNTAMNARVFVEQVPKLGYESREKYLGHFNSFEDSKNFIKSQKNTFIQNINNDGYIYGDKNPNFLPFLRELCEVWPKSKFVYIYRDGRDVVSSLLKWNDSGKKIFQMVEDGVEDGAMYPVQDLWDYSRLRPRKGEPHYESWQELSLFEKCCIYWNNYNLLALDELSKVANDRVISVNVTKSNASDYAGLFDFLELKEFDENLVAGILEQKINNSKFVSENSANNQIANNWQKWTDEQKKTYEKYALAAHLKLFNKLDWSIK